MGKHVVLFNNLLSIWTPPWFSEPKQHALSRAIYFFKQLFLRKRSMNIQSNGCIIGTRLLAYPILRRKKIWDNKTQVIWKTGWNLDLMKLIEIIYVIFLQGHDYFRIYHEICCISHRAKKISTSEFIFKKNVAQNPWSTTSRLNICLLNKSSGIIFRASL